MKHFISVLGVIASTTALCALAGPVAAQSTLEDVIAKAGAEGAVAMNVSTTRYPAEAGANLSAALKKEFGVDIKVEIVNTPPDPVVAGQIVEETRAGVAPSFDLFPIPLTFTKAIEDGGAIEPIDWAAVGVDPASISPAGNAVWIYTVPRTVFYNTNLLKGDDIPTKLEDLLDPKYKGKIAGPGFGDAYAVMSVPVLGEEKAIEWVKALYDDQGLTVIRSMSDIPSRVANGEFEIGIGIPANRTGLVDKGAPLANAPIESVSGQPYYAFVVKNAPHPNAAELLSYFFCCTEAGKKAMFDEMSWAKFDYAGSEQNAVGGEGRGLVPTPEWQVAEQGRVGAAFDAIIGK